MSSLHSLRLRVCRRIKNWILKLCPEPKAPLPTSPPGWSQDSLSAFVDDARGNQFATFHNKKEATAKLAAIDEAFLRVSSGWIDPSDFVAPTFFARSHSAFRAASSIAMAGQVFETFACLRSCLEHAGYAALIHEQPALAEVWLNRHDSDASVKAVKQAFTQTSVRAAVTALDPSIASIYDRLYQDYVDFGGHPNVLGVIGSMKVVKEGSRRIMQIIHLHGDGVPLDLALRSVARGAVCSLLIFERVFPERYAEAGVTPKMAGLKEGL